MIRYSLPEERTHSADVGDNAAPGEALTGAGPGLKSESLSDVVGWRQVGDDLTPDL